MRLLMTVAICVLLLGCQPDLSEEVATVKAYAESYEPQVRKEWDEELGEITIPPPVPFADVPDARTQAAIDKLASAGSRAHEKYIVLILLRHYRAQMELARQSYELRDLREKGISHPLVRELCRLIECGPPDAEAMFSGVEYAWVKKHPELLQYEPIRVEVERIKAVEQQIEKNLKETLSSKGKSE